ncbi:MAG: HNH endonuclease [Ktedonobacterales bacterium]
MNTHTHARADEQLAPRGSEPSYRQRSVQSAASQNSNSNSSPPSAVVRFVEDGQYDQRLSPDHTATPAVWSPWSQWSAWPNHPAILPPLPRATPAERFAELAGTIAPANAAIAHPAPSASASASANGVRARRSITPAPTVKRAPYAPPTRGASTATGTARPATSDRLASVPPAPAAPRRYSVPTPANTPTPSLARSTQSRTTQPYAGLGSARSAAQRLPPRRPAQFAGAAAVRVRPQATPATQRPTSTTATPSLAANLGWPKSFDDWMIDIVRRRALRLNSGARRRGAPGSVRAVDLAHILEQSADAQGCWHCAICHLPVTLQDLSFDHVVALADGGEHAAHNLVPAHRKCNEIKGSEKAQYRAQALDRWLSEWAGAHSNGAPTQQRRLA